MLGVESEHFDRVEKVSGSSMFGFLAGRSDRQRLAFFDRVNEAEPTAVVESHDGLGTGLVGLQGTEGLG